jgi:hypothetical protein
MKPIEKDELFKNLGDFLKNKGIELKEGGFTQQIQKGCTLLTDSINLSQAGIERAKVEIDKRLDEMRQTIHEKTAPKPGASSSTTDKPPGRAKKASSKSKSTGKKSATRKKQSHRANSLNS